MEGTPTSQTLVPDSLPPGGQLRLEDHHGFFPFAKGLGPTSYPNLLVDLLDFLSHKGSPSEVSIPERNRQTLNLQRDLFKVGGFLVSLSGLLLGRGTQSPHFTLRVQGSPTWTIDVLK